MNKYVLDTETTGLKDEDGILQISIIEYDTGNIVLNEYIKPSEKLIKRGWIDAYKIHGISLEDVINKKDITYYYDILLDIYRSGTVHIYNLQYDLRLINQSLNAFGYDSIYPKLGRCVMLDYASFYGEVDTYRGTYKWQKLSNAAIQQGIDVSKFKLHDSFGDTMLTREIMQIMNIY